jgi:Pumilio-family RNA binding repeat
MTSITDSFNSSNRASMPARTHRNSHRLSIGNENAMRTLSTQGPPISTSFLNDDDDDHRLSLNGVIDLSSPVAKAYAQLGGDNGFPTLTKTSDGFKTNSAALDLANSKSPEDDNWLTGSRVRPNHHSMPQTDSSMYRPVLSNLSSPPSERSAELSGGKSQRLSMGFSFYDDGKDSQSKQQSNISTLVRPSLPESSYSTPAVLTMKTGNFESVTTPPKTHAEQQFHNHNVSMGRIPVSAVNNRQSRDLPTSLMANLKLDDKQQSIAQAYSQSQAQSNLQASAAPFGPSYSTATEAGLMGLAGPTQAGYAAPQTYPFNMQNFNVSQMATPQMGFNSAVGTFSPQAATMYGQYGNVNGFSAYGKGPAQDGPTRGNSRRANNNVDDGRYNNSPLELHRGNIYETCKDQHGCRYLQRKLEDGNTENIQLIFLETCPHIIELMTDPFGNYLCQKLFEHCNDEQRTHLIDSASPALTAIALNQHGTRALQKMIEFVNTDQQIETIVQSLTERVVELVQDLNGNHVVQKCLNRLGAERCQFIYDAVGTHCVIVGTHRHGCCVLQRCIDHAVGFQRAQLIARITHCAFDLVQDPFGNYVVQYILDLDEPQFTQPLCMSFLGKIAPLSKQKFSSNVIEKCLRTADPDTKRALIDEMIMGNELEKMLRDSFANYVVQTALDYADPLTRVRIVECVKPILPHIKQTPHGRRIATKILGGETQGQGGRMSGNSSGQMTPNDNFSAGAAFSGRNGPTGSGRRQVQIVGGGFNTPRFNGAANGNGIENQYGANGYSMMNGHAAANDFESPTAMYNAQTFGAAQQNPYSAFQGQLGSNYF